MTKSWHFKQVWQCVKSCVLPGKTGIAGLRGDSVLVLSGGRVGQYWLVWEQWRRLESVSSHHHHVRTRPVPHPHHGTNTPGTTNTNNTNINNNINKTNDQQPRLWIRPDNITDTDDDVTLVSGHHQCSSRYKKKTLMCWRWSSCKWKQLPKLLIITDLGVQFSSWSTSLFSPSRMMDVGLWSTLRNKRQINITKLIIILLWEEKIFSFSRNIFQLLLVVRLLD